MDISEVIILIIVNTFAWLVIHIGTAWAGTKLSRSYFNPQFILFKTFPFELSFYEKVLLIKSWKSLVPDGGAMFKHGFRKKKLRSKETKYLNDFIFETCRGEIVHWVVFLFGFIFFLWNETWVGWIMVTYAFIANIPCLVLQRHTRIRLQLLQSRRSKS